MTGPRRLRRPLAEAAYVLAVAAAAAWGFSTDTTAAILLAVLLALPAGLPALIGYYVGYGLLAQLPGVNASSNSGSARCAPGGGCAESTTGDPAAWFAYTTDLLGVLALTAAAAANVLLGRWVMTRRARLGPPGPPTP